jgi:4-aminobutyrate aminotransferase-like enzyme
VIRVGPPLVLTDDQMYESLGIMEEVLLSLD